MQALQCHIPRAAPGDMPLDQWRGAAHARPALRPMVQGDADTVAQLVGCAMNADEGRQARDTFTFHFSCREHGIDDGRAYFVLPAEGVIKGIVGLHCYSWGPPENVWLAWFAVDPGAHGQGLGAQLMQAITHYAIQLGYMKLFIETYSTPEFAKARDFYRAHGFAPAGGIQAYLPNGGDMVVFCKELPARV